MKEDGELGVSDDKESIFSTLKSWNSCLNPMGTWKKKKVLKNKDNLHFLGHNLFSFIRTSWLMRTISNYRPAPLLVKSVSCQQSAWYLGKTSICPPPPPLKLGLNSSKYAIMNIKHTLYCVDPIQMRTVPRNHHLTPKSWNNFQKARVHSYFLTLSALYSVSKLYSNNDLEQDYTYK